MEDKMKKVKIVVNIIEGIAKAVGDVIKNMDNEEENKSEQENSEAQ
ncbi:MAG: hypothetical protein AB7W47_12190 [Calditrichaceae bacterium]